MCRTSATSWRASCNSSSIGRGAARPDGPGRCTAVRYTAVAPQASSWPVCWRRGIASRGKRFSQTRPENGRWTRQPSWTISSRSSPGSSGRIRASQWAGERGANMFVVPLVTAAILAASWQAPALPDTSAHIRGAAISDFNGRPIAGVMISAPEVHKFVVTDSTGRFTLDGLPSGRRAIRVSYQGRETQDYVFTLQSERTKRIAVVLDVDAVDLNPLVVEARQANLWRDLAGFYERRQAYRGFAHFFTREEIGRMRQTKLSGLLTLEGIVTRCYQECRPTRFRRGAFCAVPVSVDGVEYREMDY